MKLQTMAALAAVGACLSGCATIVNGTTQSVSVTTVPGAGARCELTNSEGKWFVTTPGSVVVHKTKTDLRISCTLDGYQTADVVVPARFKATTAGNIIAGGLIGIAVDAASGANYEYPASTTVTMTPVGASAAAPAAPATTTATPNGAGS